MQDQSIQQFRSEQFGTIRATTIDGEPWFVARDITSALGLDRTATRRLDDDEKDVRSMHTPSGEQNMTVISEAGMYSLVMASKKPEAKAFKRWVTHEVLPSIRKHGGYIEGQQDFIDGRMTNEEMVLRSMKWLTSVVEEQKRNIADLKDQNAALTEDNAKMKPKALFADSVTASSTSILVGELSTILQQNGIVTGQNRLFEFLRREGYLKRGNRSDHNMPTQRSMELGLFEIAEKTITGGDGRTRIVKTPKVTGKGQVYFVNLFNGNAARATA